MFRLFLLLPLAVRFLLLDDPDGAGDGGDGDGDDKPSDAGKDGKDGKDGDSKGFPADTPIAEMNAEQQTAYWRDKAQKHEREWRRRGDYDDLKAKAGELDKVKRSQMSDQEKAVDAARAEARTAALVEVGAKLVDAEIRAASAGRLTDDQRTVLLDGLDRRRFITEDGDVDTDKVTAFVDGIAPKTAARVDLGQGRRQGSPKPSVAAGRELFAGRRKS